MPGHVVPAWERPPPRRGAGPAGGCSPAPGRAGRSRLLPPPRRRAAGGASAAAGGRGRCFRRREVIAWSSAPLPVAVAVGAEERRAAGAVSLSALPGKAPDGSAMSYCRQEGAPGCPPNVTPAGRAGRARPQAGGGWGRCGAAARSSQPVRGRRSRRGGEARKPPAGRVWRRGEGCLPSPPRPFSSR